MPAHYEQVTLTHFITQRYSSFFFFTFSPSLVLTHGATLAVVFLATRPLGSGDSYGKQCAANARPRRTALIV